MTPLFEIATHEEMLIWQTMLQHQDSFANTLSYRFTFDNTWSIEAVQKGMSNLLNTHCRGFNYRFFERNGTLYKQFFSPTEYPVYVLPKFRSIKKIRFIEELIPLYQFEWQVKEHDSALIVHLSHLIFDGACFNDLCVAMSLAFEDKPPLQTDDTNKILVTENDLSFWQKNIENKALYQRIPLFDSFKSDSLISHSHEISKTLYKKIHDFKKAHQITLFQMITCAFSILLHHYLKDEETRTALVLSYTASTRQQNEPVGCYFNLLPLFVECDNNDSSVDLLKTIQHQRRLQKPHQHTPFLQLTSLLDEKINRGQPLFNVVINHSPGLLLLESPTIFNKKITVSPIDNHSIEKPLTLVYNYDESQLIFRIESHHGSLFQNFLQQCLGDLESILIFMVDYPEKPIGLIDLSREKTPVSMGRVLPKLIRPLFTYFESCAKIYAEKIAIRTEKESITYQAMMNAVHLMSHRIHQLDALSLQHGIGIYLPHNQHLSIALLACIAQHVSFIPLSTEFPLLTIDTLIDSTKLQYIIVEHENKSILAERYPHITFICIDDSLPSPLLAPCPAKFEQQDVAYQLFTSGSTGTPKGVLITYDNLFNFLRSMANNPGLTELDTMLAMTAISFDISINELLLPLFCGASVFIIDDKTRKDSQRLQKIIEHSNISTIQITPSSLQLLQQSGWQSSRMLRFFVGGEVLSPSCRDYFLKQKHVLFNVYGPTEATIWVSSQRLYRELPIYIGQPFDNTSFYILNSQGQSLPLGVPGELVIGGAQVAKGYSNHPNASFIEADERLYRSGDKAMAVAPDCIVYIKRLDEQVKVRGHRVELSEINHQIIMLNPGIDVITVLREKPEPHLYSFYTSHSNEDIDEASLFNQLKSILPDYKVPQALMRLTAFPLTQNGKVDKKTLQHLETITKNQVDKKKVLPKSPDNQNVITALKKLIQANFEIDIHESSASLSQYGFNSISFNALSVLIQQTFQFHIRPHEFYRWGDLDSIAKRMLTMGSESGAKKSCKKTPKTRIAIIGYDALLPQGMNAQDFFEAILNQDNLITSTHRTYLKPATKAGFIDQIEGFDRRFFNISPLEAAHMDPRQRLLLQCAFKTIEHAGYSSEALRDTTVGCFIAGTGHDYFSAIQKHGLATHPYTLSGNALNMLANRISYVFDWKGPSVTVDTACSGALSALIRAVEHLSLNPTSVCFVAAANLIADDYLNDALDAGQFLSKKAQCSTFSEEADGYVRGEGVIGFLLKPYQTALEDGDNIHGIIESFAENHGGRAQSLTAPNQIAQTRLLIDAYDDTLLSQLSYIETHGTGTQLGDPIEIDALKEFERTTSHRLPPTVFLGTLKPNIGHLEAAAGFASLLKVLLAMKHEILPANIQKEPLNALISFDASRFTLPFVNEPWNGHGNNVAGVSSFGFGGANAHIVISKAPSLQSHHGQSPTPLLFVLSAKTEQALDDRIQSLINDLSKNSRLPLKDVAYTLAVGRNPMPHRWIWVASSYEELINKLKQTHLNPVRVQEPIPPSLQMYVDAYLQNQPIDWNSLFTQTHKRVSLTPYTFDTQPFWFTQLLPKQNASRSLLDDVSIRQIQNQEWEVTLDARHPFLSQHRVFEQCILPGVTQIEFALSIIRQHDLLKYPITIEHYYWLKPLVCKTSTMKLWIYIQNIPNGLQLTFKDKDGNSYSQGVFTNQTKHYLPNNWLNDLQKKLRTQTTHHFGAQEIYRTFSTLGIDYGHYFQGIESVDVYENVLKASLSLDGREGATALLDSAFQSGMAVSLKQNQPGLMPFTLGSISILSAEAFSLKKAHVYTQKLSLYRTHFMICDTNNMPFITVIDLGVKPSLIHQGKSYEI